MDAVTGDDITAAYRTLRQAREYGDKMHIDLAEAALADVLDRFNRQPSLSHLSHVTEEAKS